MSQYNVFGQTWLSHEEWLGKWIWDDFITSDIIERFKTAVRETYKDRDYQAFKVEKVVDYGIYEFPARVSNQNISNISNISNATIDLKEFDINTMRIDPDMQILNIRRKI